MTPPTQSPLDIVTVSIAVLSWVVVGGAAGYYWGSTTTRNKLGAQA